jgi:hypothetical protein
LHYQLECHSLLCYIINKVYIILISILILILIIQNIVKFISSKVIKLFKSIFIIIYMANQNNFNTFTTSNRFTNGTGLGRYPNGNGNYGNSNYGNSNHRNSNFELSRHQLYLLELYNAQYNDIMQQINARHAEANEIRNNMNNIIAQSYSTPTSIPTSIPTQNSRHSFPSVNNRSNSNSSIQQSNEWANLMSTLLNPVPISPTPDQIRSATRQTTFAQVTCPINDRCPISLEYFGPDDRVTQINYCEHLFNPNQIATWFRSNVVCPVCRYDVRNYLEETQDNTSNSETKEETIREETKGEIGEDPRTVIRPPPPSNRTEDELLARMLLNLISEQPAVVGSTPVGSTPVGTPVYDPSNNLYFLEFLFRY